MRQLPSEKELNEQFIQLAGSHLTNRMIASMFWGIRDRDSYVVSPASDAWLVRAWCRLPLQGDSEESKFARGVGLWPYNATPGLGGWFSGCRPTSPEAVIQEFSPVEQALFLIAEMEYRIRDGTIECADWRCDAKVQTLWNLHQRDDRVPHMYDHNAFPVGKASLADTLRVYETLVLYSRVHNDRVRALDFIVKMEHLLDTSMARETLASWGRQHCEIATILWSAIHLAGDTRLQPLAIELAERGVCSVGHAVRDGANVSTDTLAWALMASLVDCDDTELAELLAGYLFNRFDDKALRFRMGGHPDSPCDVTTSCLAFWALSSFHRLSARIQAARG